MKPALLFALLTSLCVVLFVASLITGPAATGPVEALRALLLGGEGPLPLILRDIRLPRAVLAILTGGTLGVAGAALQGYLRNPLAEPGLVGISGMAALGAVLAIHTGLSAAFAMGLPLAALGGAALGVALLLWLAGPGGASLVLIFAGIAVSAMAGALTSLVLNLSPNPFAASEIIYWMMGSLADRSMLHVWLALPFVAVGWGMIAVTARGLDALTLGEDAAAALGINLALTRLLLVGGVAASVGAVTAVTGAIGFVGLVVPHLLRPLVGARPARLLWASGLGGAALVLAADIAVRVVLPERDLKLGVVMALLGAPLFLHLIYKTRSEA
ncbi:ABC transporter permease [Roseovarius sp. 22II1-1F6A]|nr:ABC transporter permease [Roseovarius sp. 22II1-1F6A]